MKKTKQRGIFGLLIDVILVFVTGGIWLIWLIVRFLRNNS